MVALNLKFSNSPYLMYLSNYELNLHLTIWSSLLILMGWTGSFLAKRFRRNLRKNPNPKQEGINPKGYP